MVNSLWKTSPSSPPCEGGERGVVISSKTNQHGLRRPGVSEGSRTRRNIFLQTGHASKYLLCFLTKSRTLLYTYAGDQPSFEYSPLPGNGGETFRQSVLPAPPW